MRQVVMTRLGNEMDLRTGESYYKLIFNDGLFEVPVSEDLAKKVAAFVYSDGSVPAKGTDTPQVPAEDQPVSDLPEVQPGDGIHAFSEDGPVDESGVGQL